MPSRRFVLKLYYMLCQRCDLQTIWGRTEAAHCRRATSLCSKPACVSDGWRSQWISTPNSCWLLAGGPCAWLNGASPIFKCGSRGDHMTLSFIMSICAYMKKHVLCSDNRMEQMLMHSSSGLGLSLKASLKQQSACFYFHRNGKYAYSIDQSAFRTGSIHFV